MKTDAFQGVWNREKPFVEIMVGPGGRGHWETALRWPNPDAAPAVKLLVSKPPDRVAEGRQTANSMMAEWDGEGTYRIDLRFDTEFTGPAPGEYDLKVTYPRP